MPDPCRVDSGAPCPDGQCPCRLPALPPPLICQGRPVDPTGQPQGQPCGEEYPARHRYAGSLDATRPETAAEHTERARRAGWLVEPIPTCPACRRPARGPIDITQYQERT